MTPCALIKARAPRGPHATAKGFSTNPFSSSDPHQLTFYLTYSDILSGILSEMYAGIFLHPTQHILFDIYLAFI